MDALNAPDLADSDRFIREHLVARNYLEGQLLRGDGTPRLVERMTQLRTYMLVHTGRCGSTFAHHKCIRFGIFPPYEIFAEHNVQHAVKVGMVTRPVTVGAYIDIQLNHLLESADWEGKTFGLSITPAQCFLVEHMYPLEHLCGMFAKSTALILLRRNVIRQALSYARVAKTGVYHRLEDEAIDEREEDPPQSIRQEVKSKEDILEHLDLILWPEHYLDNVLARHVDTRYRFYYEDVIDTPDILIRVLSKALVPGSEQLQVTTYARGTRKIPTNGHEQLYLEIMASFARDQCIQLPSGRRYRFGEFLQRYGVAQAAS